MRRYLIVLGVAAALSACASSEEVKQVQESQRKLEAKVAELEKKVAAAPAVAARPQIDPNKVYDLPIGKSPVKGPADAPVVMVEFSDFQCPFCARANPLVDQVLQAYPKEVKFVYKEFPLPMHPNALPASKAALAAQRQGKYWEMHDKLFANQGALQPDNLKQYAQEIGLDVAKFEQDMASPEVQAQISEDMQLARQAGVGGTPTLFLAGKRVQNRSLAGIKQMVDEALQAKKS
jgi:protein-disulfide isomerase